MPYYLYDILTLKTSAKRAQAVIVSSKLEYEDALEFGIAKEKIHIIPMGVVVEETKKEQNLCTNCGNLLNPSAKFCGKCGTAINSTNE